MLVKKGKCSHCGLICCVGCEHLLPNGNCAIQDSKPYGCRIAPHNPMALEKGCTYWFEEIDPVTGTVLEKITPENLEFFEEAKKQVWLTMSVEKSLDE